MDSAAEQAEQDRRRAVADQMPLPSLRPPWEQALLILAMALVLFFSLDVGLPDRERIELLTHGFGLSAEQRARLTSLREEAYAQVEAAQDAQAREYLGRYLAGDKGAYQEAWRLPGKLHGEDVKLTAFRAYILGGAAMDERNTFRALSRMNPAALDLDPKMYLYGGAYLYPVGGLIFAGKLAGLIQVTGDIAWYLDHPEQVARMYLAGRLPNALACLAVLWLLGWWVRGLAGRGAALVAMLAWALAPVVFWHALVSKPHLWAAAWSLAAVVLAHRFAVGGRGWPILASGACLGLAVGSSLAALLVALAYPVLLFDKRRPLASWWRPSLAAGLAAWVVFLITNPYAVISWQAWLQTFLGHPWRSVQDAPALERTVNYFRELWGASLAAPWGVLGCLGLAVEAWRAEGLRRRAAILGLAVLGLAAPQVGVPRATLFALPLICLGAGLVVERGLLRQPVSRMLKGGGLAVLLIPGLVLQGLQVREAVWDQAWLEPTRAMAEELAAHPGAVLAVEGLPDPTNLPPLPFLPHTVVNLARWRPGDPLPDYVLLGHLDRNGWLHRDDAMASRYRLKANLGNRPEWELGWLYPFLPLSRTAGWVYVPQGAP